MTSTFRAALTLALAAVVLLATGCNRRVSTSLQQLAFENGEVHVRFKRAHSYDYFPFDLCMHGCMPDVRTAELNEAWHPLRPDGAWRYGQAIPAPDLGEPSNRVAYADSGLYRWRSSDARCPDFHGTTGLPDAVDCQRSKFRLASRDGRYTLWEGPLKGHGLDGRKAWPHWLLIEADASRRHSIALVQVQDAEPKGRDCRGVLDELDPQISAYPGYYREESLSHDGRYLLHLIRPTRDQTGGATAWWVQRRELATGMRWCTPIEAPAEWSTSVLVQADVRDGGVEVLWIREVRAGDVSRHRLRHWREGSQPHEREVIGPTLAWDVAGSRLLIAGPDLYIGPPSELPHVFALELHDLHEANTPLQRWTFTPES